MRIHLEFSDEERTAALQALHGTSAYYLLHEIDQTLRTFLKHGNDHFKTPQDLASYLRREIADVLYKVEE
jgi:hypothetical protein